jgi:hypothetical protein
MNTRADTAFSGCAVHMKLPYVDVGDPATCVALLCHQCLSSHSAYTVTAAPYTYHAVWNLKIDGPLFTQPQRTFFTAKYIVYPIFLLMWEWTHSVIRFPSEADSRTATQRHQG